MSTLKLDIVTIFPEMFTALDCGVVGRAFADGLAEIRLWNPRDYADNPHGYVDDRPYGGGPGMVMAAEPILAAVRDIQEQRGSEGHVVVMAPAGDAFTQAMAADWGERYDHLIFICGRYEGIDQRVIDILQPKCVSIGPYVCSGGELPSMLIIDSILRLQPGVIGNPESAEQDSFVLPGLDCPHYTRPQVVEGHEVPSVLLGGDHRAIEAWRSEAAGQLTRRYRPDLADDVKTADK